jgi:Fic family protein
MLFLAARGILSTPLLYVSAYLERHRQQYYDHLLAISQRAAWEDWIVFFLNGVTEQARDAVERTDRIVALHDEYRRIVLGPKKPANLGRLVDQLFLLPAISVRLAMSVTGVTYPAARKNIDALQSLGILRGEPAIIEGT